MKSQKNVLILHMSIVLLFVFVCGLNCLPNPAKSAQNQGTGPQYGNLKLTFDNPGDVPSAFFDSPSKRADEPAVHEPRRISYPACKDGSGGLCVDNGQCPSNLKPQQTNVGACGQSQECCYGVPDSDKSCKNRGGECVQQGRCGNAPKIGGTECSGINGQVCCVYL